VGSIFAFQTFGQIDILTQGGPLKRTNVLTYYVFSTLQQDNNDGKAAVLAIALFGITFVLTLIQMRVLERRVHYGR
jgi:sn-glycerol 3-phosphate transport system permease protein